MFTVRPYLQDPSILIHWDGQNMADGSPAAVGMAGGFTLINNEPFTNSHGEAVSLVSEEKAALALTGAGMGRQLAQEYLDMWFPEPEGSVGTMFGKFEVSGPYAGLTALRLAYEDGVLIGDVTPSLTPIREGYHQRFMDIAALRPTGRGSAEVAAALGIRPAGLFNSVCSIAEDLKFTGLDRPVQAFTMLAGTAGLLPKYDGNTELRDLLRPMTEDERVRLFPEAPTKTMLMWPVEEDSDIVLRFSGQPMDQEEVNVHLGSVDQIRIKDAIIDVDNRPFTNSNGEVVQLTPRELAIFVFRAIGLEPRAAAAKAAKSGRGDLGPLWSAYDKLVPYEGGYSTIRKGELAIRMGYDVGLFKTRRHPGLYIAPTERDKLMAIIPRVAEGKTNATIGQEIGLAEGTVALNLMQLRDLLELDNAALALVVEAERRYVRPRLKG